jgi:S-DNA-T family DNA segregation ATPase FtsK/SpoIIIE
MKKKPLNKPSRKKTKPFKKNSAIFPLGKGVEAVFFLILTTYFALTLFTYSPYDPAWSRAFAHNTPIHNALGHIGAISADILYYLFGFGALSFVGATFIVALTGVFPMAPNPLPAVKRLVGILGVLPAFSILSAYYASGTHLPNGSGGVLGNHLVLWLQSVFGQEITILLALAGSLLGIQRLFGLRVLDGLEVLGFGVEHMVLALGRLSRRLFHAVWQDITAEEDQALSPSNTVRAEEKTHQSPHPDDTNFLVTHEDPGIGTKELPPTPKTTKTTRKEPYLHADIALPPRLQTNIEPKLEIASSFTDTTNQQSVQGHEINDADSEDNPRVAILKETLPPKGPVKVLPLRKIQTEMAANRDHAPTLPSLSLLAPPLAEKSAVTPEFIAETSRLIEARLLEFGVEVAVREAHSGPVVTRYEIEPAIGVKGSQIVSLIKDLARALSVGSIRALETIPGKTYMGLEIPNARRKTVRLSEVLHADIFKNHPSPILLGLGQDISGKPVVADLAKMPHLLVAGTTGSGKSVGINAMILSILFRATPEAVRFILIDPKMLELSIYEGIPHLLCPVVTDMREAANALSWCVGEMDRRYRTMAKIKVRNLQGYNQTVREKTLYDDDGNPLAPMPSIVVVIDELADLMMLAGKKVEELIARLAQKARAAGIHLILATQRPSVDVITGLIKANIPTRIAFQVSSKVDSRTILDQGGAESLLGQGDMLYLPPGSGFPLRIHGAFVADEEVIDIVDFLRETGMPDYQEEILADPEPQNATADHDAESDPLYDQAVQVVLQNRKASVSLVQRHLRIGYNRAARLVETMERAGLVSPMQSNGNREILVNGDNR